VAVSWWPVLAVQAGFVLAVCSVGLFVKYVGCEQNKKGHTVSVFQPRSWWSQLLGLLGMTIGLIGPWILIRSFA
jgi:hypothetical protein